MDKTEVRFTIDANGNLRRELVDLQQQQDERKRGLLKRIMSAVTLCVTAEENRS